MAVSAIFWTTEAALRSARLSSRETEHVQVFIRRLSLGLDQGNQQHLVSATFGSPSEARDLVGGPQHALMPRALRGRFEPLDHFVLGQFTILGPASALGSPHAAKRFIGLAIVVRGKDRGSRITHRSHEHRATGPRRPPRGSRSRRCRAWSS